MADADCDADYKRCKSKCFDVLVDALAEAGDDPEKKAGAIQRYKSCRNLCRSAKTVCDAETP